MHIDLLRDYKEILFNTALIFSSVFELVLAYIMTNSFFTSRFRRSRFDYLPFVGLAAVIILLRDSFPSEFVRYSVECALLIAILFLMYTDSVRRKVIASVVFVMIIALSETGAGFLFSVVSRAVGFEGSMDASYIRLGKLTLANGIMIVAAVIVSIFAKRYTKVPTSFRLWAALFFVPVVTLVTFSVYQFYFENYPVDDKIAAYVYVSCTGLIFINILVFVLFGKLRDRLALARGTEMLSSLLTQQENSVKRLETLYNRTRSFRHDMKNHILLLNMLAEKGDTEGLKKYLRDLGGAVDESDYVRITGISAVDAILNEKMYEAQSKDITTSYNCVNLEKNDILPIDLCIILSNALDNAIEANSLVEDKTRRFIKVKAHGNETFTVISVSNPTDSEPKKNAKGLYETSKADADSHGFGLRSIESTVNKYHGEMLMKCEDGVFTLVVRLNGV